jgi:PKD repeat protein
MNENQFTQEISKSAMKHFGYLLLLFSLFLFHSAQSQQYVIPQGLKTDQYVSKTLLFKLREANRSIAQNNHINSNEFNEVLSQLGTTTLKKNFPSAKQPSKKFNESGEALADLTLIYELHYTEEISIYTAASLLQKTGLFEYIQPRFISKPMAVPNDPLVSQQYHHALIKTFEAWDVEQGDTSVFIGITDAGIQFEHEDLENVAYNYADPINGIDDDGNGYIDDFRGWNTANNTNNPTATLSPHGMFTTGMSNATSNNGLGLAGNANKCRFVPIRIDDANGFSYGYEGIVYAAARGCQIVNASWGSTFANPVSEEAIRYATVNEGMLIIAAAGNSGINEKYYPASYENVFSVGATGASDLKWSSSTFSPAVDIVAPGELVRSCWPFNGYDISSGTSFSAPLVAGAAALVKSHFPNYNSEQIAERIRVTADTSIYSLAGNANWVGMMGSGRLNMLRALTDPEKPSVHFTQVQTSDLTGDSILQPGETIQITGIYKNFLAPTQNLNAVISCSSPYVTLLSSSNNLGIISTLSSISNAAQPFSIQVNNDVPYNHDILIRIDYSDVGYAAFEYIELRLNPDYLNIDINRLHTTITSRGSIGYNNNYATNGLGITFENNNSLIYASGFMLGSSALKTADNVYAASIPGYDNDFIREQGAQYTVNNANEQHIQSQFYTDSASNNRIQVIQTSSALAASSDDAAVVIRYVIKNTGATAVNGLSGGVFTDWDIQNASSNGAAWDTNRKLSYAFAPGGIYAGIKLLEGPAAHSYCFNSNGASGSINLIDGFSNAEKFATLSGSQTRNNAAIGDVANLIGTGAFNLAAGDSITLSFVILAANDLAALQVAADRAQSLFNFNSLNANIVIQDASCSNIVGNVSISSSTANGASVSILNEQGTILSSSNNLSNFSFGNLPSGNYQIRFNFTDNTTYNQDFQITYLDPISLDITASAEVLAYPNTIVDFTANAQGATSYYWDFNDDSPTSEEQNPTHDFYVEGNYTVSCVSSNGVCSDTAYINIIIDASLGFNKIDESLSISPNPANDFVKVNCAEMIDYIRVFDIEGREIMNQISINSDNAQFNVSTWESGIYILELSTNKLIQRKKFVVNN